LKACLDESAFPVEIRSGIKDRDINQEKRLNTSDEIEKKFIRCSPLF